jgi:hypothetical protein
MAVNNSLVVIAVLQLGTTVPGMTACPLISLFQ